MTLHGSRSSNVLLNRLTCTPFIISNEHMDEAGKTQVTEQWGQITVDMSQVLVLAVIFGLLRQWTQRAPFGSARISARLLVIDMMIVVTCLLSFVYVVYVVVSAFKLLHWSFRSYDRLALMELCVSQWMPSDAWHRCYINSNGFLFTFLSFDIEYFSSPARLNKKFSK